MALKLSVVARNARLDAFEVAVGASAIMKIFDGALPANCAAADAGTKLAEIALPADWMGAAAGGVKAMSGTWSDNDADADGSADYFRVYASDGVTCHMQGTCSEAGGGGDMILDSIDLQENTQFSITAFSLTDANA